MGKYEIMGNCQKQHFERPAVWSRTSLVVPQEKARIKETLRNIPSDVRSILDVGCGNGLFVNTLSRTSFDTVSRITGLDSSAEALKYVETEKTEGSIAHLCYEDNSFDMVACLEVLEHLREDEFERGISELQRVSRQYILVTVPNDQDLLNSLVTCTKCYCRFNPCYHLRSFNKGSLENLFSDFRPVVVKEIGPPTKKRYYNHVLISFYQSLKTPILREGTICPQCGYEQKKEREHCLKQRRSGSGSPVILALSRGLARAITRVSNKRRWLLALYEKVSRADTP
ncbi:MAG: class I SAM-dependent methyltransferase [Planctomycetota bacterium]|nr:class I SAM-dependent methyltransferase [Planctomycetota bacterium]